MRRILIWLLLAAGWTAAAKDDPPSAPFIDAKAVRERFATITPAEIEELRGLRILVASKSLGLNLMDGFGRLAKENPSWKPVLRRYDVEKKGGLPIVPADAFKEPGVVHILSTRYPLIRRAQEVDELLRKEPWGFGGRVDAVVIIYSAVKPETFDEYARIMDRLAADFPNTCFIHATAGLNARGPKERDNADQHAFSERLRRAYRGRAPVYDLGAILSQDFRDGPVMVPEFTQDPTGVHPNLAEGELAMARGFALALRDGVRWRRQSAAAGKTAATPPPPTDPAVPVETLPADHPEYRAVRAILDRNGLTAMRVEGQVEVRGGHVVRLFIQECGVVEIPEEIGRLTSLELLHCYADRRLDHPFLKRISPAIGQCTELRELLINGNDLETLPAEIARLMKIERLSLADNLLRDLPPAAAQWARRHDPEGLKRQRTP
jgi:hypothetical protein